jgi:hypothetical protein
MPALIIVDTGFDRPCSAGNRMQAKMKGSSDRRLSHFDSLLSAVGLHHGSAPHKRIPVCFKCNPNAKRKYDDRFSFILLALLIFFLSGRLAVVMVINEGTIRCEKNGYT